MIGKIKVTSTGYDPEKGKYHPDNFDATLESDGLVPVTTGRLEALRNEHGGYYPEQLAELGIAWPPPTGWQRELVASKLRIPLEAYRVAWNKRSREPVQSVPPREIRVTPIGRQILLAVEFRERLGRVTLSPGSLAKELRLCVILAVGPKVATTHPQLAPGVAVWIKPGYGTEVVINRNLALFATPDKLVGRASSGTGCMTMYRILDGPTKYVTVEPLYRTATGASFTGARVIYENIAAARASIDQTEFSRLDRTDSDNDDLIERWL